MTLGTIAACQQLTLGRGFQLGVASHFVPHDPILVIADKKVIAGLLCKAHAFDFLVALGSGEQGFGATALGISSTVCRSALEREFEVIRIPSPYLVATWYLCAGVPAAQPASILACVYYSNAHTDSDATITYVETLGIVRVAQGRPNTDRVHGGSVEAAE